MSVIGRREKQKGSGRLSSRRERTENGANNSSRIDATCPSVQPLVSTMTSVHLSVNLSFLALIHFNDSSYTRYNMSICRLHINRIVLVLNINELLRQQLRTVMVTIVIAEGAVYPVSYSFVYSMLVVV